MNLNNLSFTERQELDEEFKLYCTKHGTAYTPCNMIAFLQQKERDAQKHIISYLNDNHTFVELTEDVEESLNLIRHHFVDNGQSYGMLCRKGSEPVHANGDWDEFKGKVREWYRQNVEETMLTTVQPSMAHGEKVQAMLKQEYPGKESPVWNADDKKRDNHIVETRQVQYIKSVGEEGRGRPAFSVTHTEDGVEYKKYGEPNEKG